MSACPGERKARGPIGGQAARGYGTSEEKGQEATARRQAEAAEARSSA